MTRYFLSLSVIVSLVALAGCKTTVSGGSGKVCKEGATRACTDDDGNAGNEVCEVDASGRAGWGACEREGCEAGAIRDCTAANGVSGIEYCFAQSEEDCGYDLDCKYGESGYWGGCEAEVTEEQPDEGCTGGGEGGGYGDGCSTPLVLSFDSAAVRYTTEMAGDFDMTGLGMSRATDWPTAATPWLALDRDGNGAIDDAGELFGSATRLPDGGLAANGFVALRLLDDNGDGRIDAQDPAFARLALWADTDSDRASGALELTPAASRLVSIDLAYVADARCDGRGNCEVERASFRFLDETGTERTGAIVDVHLKAQR